MKTAPLLCHNCGYGQSGENYRLQELSTTRAIYNNIKLSASVQRYKINNIYTYMGHVIHEGRRNVMKSRRHGNACLCRGCDGIDLGY